MKWSFLWLPKKTPNLGPKTKPVNPKLERTPPQPPSLQRWREKFPLPHVLHSADDEEWVELSKSPEILAGESDIITVDGDGYDEYGEDGSDDYNAL
jgi:hypothetical protein